MTRAEIAALLVKRDGDGCRWCGLPFGTRKAMKRTFDHLIPKALGGSNVLENLCLAHAICNELRGIDDFETARRVVRERPKRHRGGWASPAVKALRLTVLSTEFNIEEG